ncbi:MULTISPECIES: ROK family transcriptional regulator [Exiguobacterium]|uniref:ROK family transcriptional regulator n=2 Tax=Exiguobacterium antarcticum TaxID=132920 RepID=A0ABT6R395_9BACL|nr:MULTISPECIES: ROK family transcriptional regulator [Exiguobacterium]AFS69506.1 Xylose repressor [Exiguobacterium antarcticum B7]MCT4781451.1 ROK family transcriptional regulator [Exiguobacterium soli]MDI3235414.1 ROK family transcriptional regulator [Exiguobacterium antarcticum]
MVKEMPRNSKWMRSYNRALVLRLIRMHQPISRVELAQQTKLTKPTVSNIVGELIADQLVMERELGVSNGGRKPILLELVAKEQYVIGIDATSHRFIGVIADLSGNTIHEVETMGKFDTNEELMEAVVQLCQELIDATEQVGTIHGIGISVHGMVNPETGVILFAPRFHLHDVALKEHLEQRFAYPVFIENDVRALASFELLFGEGVGVDQFFYLYAGEGIGGAYVLDGKLIDGENHITGEVGHMRLDLDGPICSCGNRGCLEALAGEKALLRDFEAIDPQVKTLTDLRRRLTEGDSHAKAAYHRAGEYIGIGVLNTIHLINPKRILLGGPMFELAPSIVDQIKERVAHTALTTASRETDVKMVPWSEKQGALSAAALATNSIFQTI